MDWLTLLVGGLLGFLSAIGKDFLLEKSKNKLKTKNFKRQKLEEIFILMDKVSQEAVKPLLYKDSLDGAGAKIAMLVRFYFPELNEGYNKYIQVFQATALKTFRLDETLSAEELTKYYDAHRLFINELVAESKKYVQLNAEKKDKEYNITFAKSILGIIFTVIIAIYAAQYGAKESTRMGWQQKEFDLIIEYNTIAMDSFGLLSEQFKLFDNTHNNIVNGINVAISSTYSISNNLDQNITASVDISKMKLSLNNSTEKILSTKNNIDKVVKRNISLLNKLLINNDNVYLKDILAAYLELQKTLEVYDAQVIPNYTRINKNVQELPNVISVDNKGKELPKSFKIDTYQYFKNIPESTNNLKNKINLNIEKIRFI